MDSQKLNLNNEVLNENGVISRERTSQNLSSIISSCSTKISKKNFQNYWVIENFPIQSELCQSGENLVAPPFGDDQHEFALKLFPNGKDEENWGYISLFLLINKCPNYRLRFRVNFTIETSKGPRDCTSNKKLLTINRSGMVTASKFFFIDDLKKMSSLYIPNDTLTIGVEITVFGEPETIKEYTPYDPSISRKIFRSHEDTEDDEFLDLLETGEHSDFVISASCGHEFNVHIAILVSRSDYFRAMLRNESTKEKMEGKVQFKDIGVDILDIILRHIYSPKSTGKRLSSKMISFELVSAVDRFMLDSLKEDLVILLLRDLNISNIVEQLQMADLLRHGIFYNRLIHFFRANMQKIVKSQEWIQFRHTNPDLVMRFLENSMEFHEDKVSEIYLDKILNMVGTS